MKGNEHLLVTLGDERNTLDERNAPWRLLEIKRMTTRDSWRQKEHLPEILGDKRNTTWRQNGLLKTINS
ncbi:unnamed protein product [Rhizophagus irregularis]|nr:unnamed protein product [Rhizophagus irregularis]